MLTLLTSCSRPEIIISGDTSCESFSRIHFNEAQRKAVADNWDLWEVVAFQVASHNITYDAKCINVLGSL